MELIHILIVNVIMYDNRYYRRGDVNQAYGRNLIISLIDGHMYEVKQCIGSCLCFHHIGCGLLGAFNGKQLILVVEFDVWPPANHVTCCLHECYSYRQ